MKVPIYNKTNDFGLGSCCMCRKCLNVRNVVMPNVMAPGGGIGWGCVQCGLEPKGAVAVLCDHCYAEHINDQKPIPLVCEGYPEEDIRIPVERCQVRFDHDYSKHPEISAFSN